MGGRGRGLGREARRQSFFTNSRHCTNPPSTNGHSSRLCSGQPFLVHQTRQNARIQALTQRVLRAAFPCWRGIVASTNPPSTTTQATSLPLHLSLSLSLCLPLPLPFCLHHSLDTQCAGGTERRFGSQFKGFRDTALMHESSRLAWRRVGVFKLRFVARPSSPCRCSATCLQVGGKVNARVSRGAIMGPPHFS